MTLATTSPHKAGTSSSKPAIADPSKDSDSDEEGVADGMMRWWFRGSTDVPALLSRSFLWLRLTSCWTPSAESRIALESNDAFFVVNLLGNETTRSRRRLYYRIA